MIKVLILIPARFASSRFPGKPLAKILDKSMIQRVFENCQKAGEEAIQADPEKASNEVLKNSPQKFEFDCFVVTDDEQIEKHVKDFGGNVVRVDDDVPSGTERIHLAYQKYFSKNDYQYIINVQGDEPLLSGKELYDLVSFHSGRSDDFVTLVRPMKGLCDSYQDSNRVKAIYVAETGRCHYFSRSPIPFKRAEDLDDWYLHIGVYSFKPESLKRFCEKGPSFYERMEGLEQLRGLDLDMKIGAIQTFYESMGVDTPSDIKKIEGVLSAQA